MANKEIKVTLKSRTQLSITEAAEPSDFIDIDHMDDKLDTTQIDALFESLRDHKIEEEVNRKVSKEKQLLDSSKKNEIDAALAQREKQLYNEKENALKAAGEQYQNKIDQLNVAKTKLESEVITIANDKDAKYKFDIQNLKAQIEKLEAQKTNVLDKNKIAIAEATAPLNQTIIKLETQLAGGQKQLEMEKASIANQKDYEYKMLIEDLKKANRIHEETILELKTHNK
ncbi:hypothetical protein Barb6_03539 [Bacteroidales bacterium Barb6]|nr:hypothetical protein Barb6_03539 [Bacteroidales bacterium Barb6]